THRHDPLLCFYLPARAPPDIYTLSLHDALPIYVDARRARLRTRSERRPHTLADDRARGHQRVSVGRRRHAVRRGRRAEARAARLDRKSTRLNSSHDQISYAVFCLKKKKKKATTT